jgi:hypothetical protein
MVVPVFTIEHKERGKLGSQMVSVIKGLGRHKAVPQVRHTGVNV